MSEQVSSNVLEWVEAVERAMLDVVGRELRGRGGRMVREQLASGGKRLRPRVVHAAAGALEVPREHAVAWAAAIELLHNATLVHDDVQDGDRFRRGRPTLWARHGAPQAINAGDAMLMLPFLALSSLPPVERARLMTLLATSAIDAVRGQIAEIDLLPDEHLDWASYLDAAGGKTGALFSLPLAGVALLTGMSESEARDIGEPLRRLGLAFQIQDDVLDLYGNKGRDQIGSDLREGKVSALVVTHLECRPDDRPWLLELLRASRASTPESGIARASAAFRESGALDLALERARTLRDEAARAPAWSSRPSLSAAMARLFDEYVPSVELALQGCA